MKSYLGLGSNVGDRLDHLERAVSEIKKFTRSGAVRVSPVYETPALLPDLVLGAGSKSASLRAPSEWNLPFLNLVLEADLPHSPEELLRITQEIETRQGRGPHERWAPRVVDIDLLFYGEESHQSDHLTLPHPGVFDRAFVMDPLKDLVPTAYLERARRHPQHAPLWMGVLNVTPDSFSGTHSCDPEELDRTLDDWDAHFVGILDVGAESTRPGATPVRPDEEWARIGPVLRHLRDRYGSRTLRPMISVDTRHAHVAALSIEYGAQIINDVSGLGDPAMLDVVRGSQVEYVLMHSLSIPADPKRVLPQDLDPVAEIKSWFIERARNLEESGIQRDRIILDPGIGFGKDSLQSLEILKGMARLSELPYRILVGHSRKSFLRPFSALPDAERDLESIGISLGLVSRGVDILRVHDPVANIRAFRAWNHLNPSRPAGRGAL